LGPLTSLASLLTICPVAVWHDRRQAANEATWWQSLSCGQPTNLADIVWAQSAIAGVRRRWHQSAEDQLLAWTYM
jgi:hypothetical protein